MMISEWFIATRFLSTKDAVGLVDERLLISSSESVAVECERTAPMVGDTYAEEKEKS